MKVISTGIKYNIFPDDLKSYEELPVDYYIVRFSDREGFSLEKYSEFKMTDAKIYGVHLRKAEKVLKSFSVFNRNLGVILSGDKGIGKSLFSRLLGRKAVENGYPVIIVDKYIENIGSFLDSIDQEVMILFDEFDKTFSETGKTSGVQANMLSLFDGVAQGKKLYVVTCNELRGLNSFLVNRPGRFHYHFRFDYPTEDDIREYLMDSLCDKYYSEIDAVIDFSKRVALNYDCLRAIAFEINNDQDFSTAIQDLNIINVDEEKFRICVLFKDGTKLANTKVMMDSFSNDIKRVSLYDANKRYAGDVSFMPAQIGYNSITRELNLKSDNIELEYYDYDLDDNENRQMEQDLRKREIQKVLIERIASNDLHYRWR